MPTREAWFTSTSVRHEGVDGPMDLGDLSSDDLKEIFSHKKFRLFYETHLSSYYSPSSPPFRYSDSLADSYCTQDTSTTDNSLWFSSFLETDTTSPSSPSLSSSSSSTSSLDIDDPTFSDFFFSSTSSLSASSSAPSPVTPSITSPITASLSPSRTSNSSAQPFDKPTPTTQTTPTSRTPEESTQHPTGKQKKRILWRRRLIQLERELSQETKAKVEVQLQFAQIAGPKEAPFPGAPKSQRKRTQEKTQRLIWTPELQSLFQRAIEYLGPEEATPKAIQIFMGVPGLTRENVSSHLQKQNRAKKRLLSQAKTEPAK